MIDVFAETYGRLSKLGYVRAYPDRDEVTGYKWRLRAYLPDDIGKVLSIKSLDVINMYSKDEELLMAFIAGLIDSDGTVAIYVTRKRIPRERIVVDYTIAIYSSNKEFLEKLREALRMYGYELRIRLNSKAIGKPHTKGLPRYRNIWEIYTQNSLTISKLLPKILKYMKHREKVEKAKLLLGVVTGKIPKDPELISKTVKEMNKRNLRSRNESVKEAKQLNIEGYVRIIYPDLRKEDIPKGTRIRAGTLF